LINGDNCNVTCNFENDVSTFVGQVGNPGHLDATGTSAQIGSYGTVTVDNDYLYIADLNNAVIRRVEIASAQVETIAGTPGNTGFLDAPDGDNAMFDGPESLATDGTTLWVGDGANRRIRAIDLTSPTFAVTTVAGTGAQGIVDGAALSATFDGLRALTYDDGNIYFLDGAAGLLRRFDTQANTVVTLAGSPYNPGTQDGQGGNVQFDSPRYMTSNNSGTLYIADTNGFHIRAYDIAGDQVSTFLGDGTKGYVDAIGNSARIHRPRGLTTDGTSVYICEYNKQTVRQVVESTAAVTTMMGTPCDFGVNNCNGAHTDAVGSAAAFNGPMGIAFHYPSNSLFIFDSNNSVIRRIQ
jgi:sugar lactone lactonase YvrE